MTPPEADPFDFAFNPSGPEEQPLPVLPPVEPLTRSEEKRLIAAALGSSSPMPEIYQKEFRLNLGDLSLEEQIELARETHNTIGKASGYLPDFNSQTEHMKAAYMRVVRDIWIAVQRKVRTYNE